MRRLNRALSLFRYVLAVFDHPRIKAEHFFYLLSLYRNLVRRCDFRAGYGRDPVRLQVRHVQPQQEHDHSKVRAASLR